MVGVPALAMWTWGPSSRICWPMLFLTSQRMSSGVDEHGHPQGDASRGHEARSPSRAVPPGGAAARRPPRRRSSKGTRPVADRSASSRGPCRPRSTTSPGPGQVDGQPMASARSGSTTSSAGPAMPGADLPDDGRRGPRTVGLSEREHDHVGPPRRHRAHLGPLAPVAVAPAPEQRRSPGRPRPGPRAAVEGHLEPGRGVGVVDDHRERGPGGHHLHPPGHRRGRPAPRPPRPRPTPSVVATAAASQGVVHVERPRQAPARPVGPATGTTSARPVVTDLGRLGPAHRHHGRPGRPLGRGSRRPQGSSTLTTAAPGPGRGRTAAALAAKYASMVPWWSRWSRLRLVKAATSKTMPSTRCWASAWDDTSMATARRPGVPELGQQASGGPGPRAWSASPSRVPITRWPAPVRSRIGPDQVGHRGLAVGPGDPDHGQVRARVPVEGRTPPRPWPAAPARGHHAPGSRRDPGRRSHSSADAPRPPPRRHSRGRRCGRRARSRTATPARPGGCRTRRSGSRSTPGRRALDDVDLLDQHGHPHGRVVQGLRWSEGAGDCASGPAHRRALPWSLRTAPRWYRWPPTAEFERRRGGRGGGRDAVVVQGVGHDRRRTPGRPRRHRRWAWAGRGPRRPRARGSRPGRSRRRSPRRPRGCTRSGWGRGSGPFPSCRPRCTRRWRRWSRCPSGTTRSIIVDQLRVGGRVDHPVGRPTPWRPRRRRRGRPWPGPAGAARRPRRWPPRCRRRGSAGRSPRRPGRSVSSRWTSRSTRRGPGTSPCGLAGEVAARWACRSPRLPIWARSRPSPSSWAISMVPMLDDWARISLAVSRSVPWASASWKV